MIKVERMNVQLQINEEDLGKYLAEGYKEVKKEIKGNDKDVLKEQKTIEKKK